MQLRGADRRRGANVHACRYPHWVHTMITNQGVPWILVLIVVELFAGTGLGQVEPQLRSGLREHLTDPFNLGGLTDDEHSGLSLRQAPPKQVDRRLSDAQAPQGLRKLGLLGVEQVTEEQAPHDVIVGRGERNAVQLPSRRCPWPMSTSHHPSIVQPQTVSCGQLAQPGLDPGDHLRVVEHPGGQLGHGRSVLTD
jgi:hypothetical protein